MNEGEALARIKTAMTKRRSKEKRRKTLVEEEERRWPMCIASIFFSSRTSPL